MDQQGQRLSGGMVPSVLKEHKRGIETRVEGGERNRR